MSEFHREERYIVVKRKHLDEAAESALRGVVAGLDLETIECVVVEWDQPNYEATWQSVRQVAEGTYDPDEITTLRQKLDQAEARCAELENKVERMRQAGNRVISYGAKHSEWLMAIDPTRSADTWLLRKQAEAVDAAVSALMPSAYGAPDDPPPEYNAACEMCADFRDYANRLRQQATEIESGDNNE